MLVGLLYYDLWWHRAWGMNGFLQNCVALDQLSPERHHFILGPYSSYLLRWTPVIVTSWYSRSCVICSF